MPRTGGMGPGGHHGHHGFGGHHHGSNLFFGPRFGFFGPRLGLFGFFGIFMFFLFFAGTGMNSSFLIWIMVAFLVILIIRGTSSRKQREKQQLKERDHTAQRRTQKVYHVHVDDTSFKRTQKSEIKRPSMTSKMDPPIDHNVVTAPQYCMNCGNKIELPDGNLDHSPKYCAYCGVQLH